MMSARFLSVRSLRSPRARPSTSRPCHILRHAAHTPSSVLAASRAQSSAPTGSGSLPYSAADLTYSPPPSTTPPRSLFTKMMVANRGEISIRVLRAATELGISSVSIYSYEDRYCPHRYKADASFLIGRGLSPVAAYLNIPEVIALAKAHDVTAIHPGYGFLSESAAFAEACAEAGVIFIGPSPEALRTFGDKVAARALAVKVGVPVVPGTPGPVSTPEEVKSFIAAHGLPVIIKAAHGGGGRGMRVVRSEGEVVEAFNRAVSEAKAAFGRGEVFIERYIEHPRHVEVQVLADRTGAVMHLFERDCSVQRRHQKVVEMAPARDLPPAVRERMLQDAVKLCRAAKYVNAGTVEFLLDTSDGKAYFMEVNPRIQVEHTVTEEVTGVDIVQTQIKLAAGMTFEEMGMKQEDIHVNGCAVQCRITTEDPARNFTPDSGILSVYRTATGNGIRLDDGPGYPGAPITPHYDSLLVKVTARAATFDAALAKLVRALREHRIRGVSTNIPFLLNVLNHPAFAAGAVTTRFIEMYPDVLRASSDAQNRGEKMLRYLANVAVNGPDPALGAVGPACTITSPTLPRMPLPRDDPSKPVVKPFLRSVLTKSGPAAFAKAVREHEHTLVMDTTWRDAHQSLLATRVRSRDILAVGAATRVALGPAFALECWGGATFDVAMRFLRECPWDRLAAMREAVPDVPFQMLFRGANAVGYTSYPDNVVHKFCDTAVKHGMDVFRVFDSLNYVENMKLGIDAVGAAGGVVEAAICYTGDVYQGEMGARGADYKYKLEYYLKLARAFVDAGTHMLSVKDMAGLLTPQSATMLISALRAEFPAVPIHVHTHDTAGTGVASMVAAVRAGADVVDAAIDSLSGSTSQPSLGALVAALAGTPHATQLDMRSISALNEYWEECRAMYSAFESGQLTGSSDVYEHEMPGGQLTNLLYQSKQLGLGGPRAWSEIKKAYAAANRVLGDIVKVTPSSKVVGDLAQFMVANRLTESQVHAQASTLSFPQSVIEYLQGFLGIPEGGFPEPFRSNVLKGRKLPSGKDTFTGRPGAEMPSVDIPALHNTMREKYGESVRDVDVMSAIMYPKVFDDWMRFTSRYGDVSVIPTPYFTRALKIGEEVSFEIEKGKTLYIRLKAIGDVDDTGHREVMFELNGETRILRVADIHAGVIVKSRAKADKANAQHVGAPMPGVVVDVRVSVGKKVKAGDALAVLSAMKLETIVTATRDGAVKSIAVTVGDNLEAGDLVVVVE